MERHHSMPNCPKFVCVNISKSGTLFVYNHSFHNPIINKPSINFNHVNRKKCRMLRSAGMVSADRSTEIWCPPQQQYFKELIQKISKMFILGFDLPTPILLLTTTLIIASLSWGEVVNIDIGSAALAWGSSEKHRGRRCHCHCRNT